MPTGCLLCPIPSCDPAVCGNGVKVGQWRGSPPVWLLIAVTGAREQGQPLLSQPELSQRAQLHRRGGCSQRLWSLESLQPWAGQGTACFVSSPLKKNAGKNLYWLRGGCNLSKAEAKGRSGGSRSPQCGCAPVPGWAGAEGQAKAQLGSLCVEVAAQHMHRHWRRRDKSTK